MRFSLCCGRDGCRRRVLPPSVRFWNRRVYWAPVVLLVTALRQGKSPAITLERLKSLCGLWRSTVKRWQRYFQNIFPKSDGYRRLGGHLLPGVTSDQLLVELISCFYRVFKNPETALVNCLRMHALGP